GRFVTRETLRAGGLDDLLFPVVVKPNYEGSSKGITQNSVVDEPNELARTIEEMLLTYPEGLLVEQYIAGVDVSVCFLEGLSPQEPIPKPVDFGVDPAPPRVHAIYDYDLNPRARAHVTRRIPPALSDSVIERARSMSERVAAALGLRDAAK